MRYVIGNWKMNTNLSDAVVLAGHVAQGASDFADLSLIVAPPLPWIVPVKESIRWQPVNFHIASQVVSRFGSGAYTGDVSASQLAPLVTHCLVGHSERREFHNESGEIIRDQIKQLVAHTITPIVCFGEYGQSQDLESIEHITDDLHKDLKGLTTEALAQCIFAYEPIWAIGSSNPASPEYASAIIGAVKNWMKDTFGLAQVPILYGGSVTEDDAGALGSVGNIDGLLVGGASLHAKQFLAICRDFSGHV